MISIEKICEDLNARAGDLAPRLLPNGHYDQRKTAWHASGIADRGGGSSSLKVDLTGTDRGRWFDFGNCHADERRGDMLDLVRLKACNGDHRAAIEWAKAELGIVDDWSPGERHKPGPEEMAARAAEARARAEAREAEMAADREARAKGARALYLHKLTAPIGGTPAEAYLRGRDLLPGAAQGRSWPNALRFHPAVWHGKAGCKIAAMLAPMYLADGRHMATHRTFIERRGGHWVKVSAHDAKMVIGPCAGAFIPINKGSSGKSMRDIPAGEPVYVTEGIEDAIVVRMMRPAARIVAAYSITNMGMMLLPEAACELVIVCDRDESPKAQDQLEQAIAKQQARGLTVRTVMPPKGVKDMNDWLRAWLRDQGKGAAA